MRAQVLQDLREAGGTATAKELVDAGARWEDIYALRDQGVLTTLSRGVYRLADAPPTAHLDFLAVCRRVPHGTICANSAANYWDLTDEIPDTVHLAIPRGKRPPVLDYPPTTVHIFATSTFELGRIERTLESGEQITITSLERTVVDLFRLRAQLGRDQAFAALRRYLRLRDAQPGSLLELARQLRVGTVLAGAMEPLLS